MSRGNLDLTELLGALFGREPEGRFRLQRARARPLMLATRPWITCGAQIMAARALLGWTRRDLAEAAGLHPNGVGYWEAREQIPAPPHAEAPMACNRMMRALREAGVVMVSSPGPGVAFKPTTDQKFAAKYGKDGTASAAFEAMLRAHADTGSEEQLPPG